MEVLRSLPSHPFCELGVTLHVQRILFHCGWTTVAYNLSLSLWREWPTVAFTFSLLYGKSGLHWPIQFSLSLWKEWPIVAYTICPFPYGKSGLQWPIVLFPFLMERVAFSGL